MSKKFYLTTAIAYVNAKPHLGFAYEVIQADVLARLYRTLGDKVYFLTGTDEHGTKNFEAATQNNLDPQSYVDKMSKYFSDLKQILNLTNDDFIRTSDKQRHHIGAQKLWQECEKSGDIYKKVYSGYYCVGCEAFVTEKELDNGSCPIHKKPAQFLEEENYFFKLSRYTDQIKELITTSSLRIIPESKKNEVVEFLNLGLEDISISRPKKRLSWGVPVPNDSENVIYIWFDALSNYITALGYGTDESKFQKWWPADLHIIGKDISRFHCIYWIGMLLSAKLEIPKTIYIHGFITSNGEKMSKSLGNVIDPVEMAEKYGEEALRYYLLKEIPAGFDGDFTIARFEEVYNADLANGLGNLVNRSAKLAQSLDLEVSEPSDKPLLDQSFVVHLQNVEFNEAVKYIWDKIHKLDAYIEEKRPWELINNDKEQAIEVVSNLVRQLREVSELLGPILPATSENLKEIFKGPKIIKPGKPLFPRLDIQDVH